MLARVHTRRAVERFENIRGQAKIKGPSMEQVFTVNIYRIVIGCL